MNVGCCTLTALYQACHMVDTGHRLGAICLLMKSPTSGSWPYHKQTADVQVSGSLLTVKLKVFTSYSALPTAGSDCNTDTK